MIGRVRRAVRSDPRDGGPRGVPKQSQSLGRWGRGGRGGRIWLRTENRITFRFAEQSGITDYNVIW